MPYQAHNAGLGLHWPGRLAVSAVQLLGLIDQLKALPLRWRESVAASECGLHLVQRMEQFFVINRFNCPALPW